MMKYPQRITLCGMGGQGIILSAVLLGTTAVTKANKYAVQTQSYGSEARGGQCQAELIIDRSPINSPIAPKKNLLVALFQTAYEKYIDDLEEDGVLVIDPQLVTRQTRKVAHTFEVPATQIAVDLGNRMAANMVMLGFLSQCLGTVGHLIGTGIHLGGRGTQVTQSRTEFVLEILNGVLNIGKVALEWQRTLAGEIAAGKLAHAVVDGGNILIQLAEGEIQASGQLTKLIGTVILHMGTEFALGQIVSSLIDLADHTGELMGGVEGHIQADGQGNGIEGNQHNNEYAQIVHYLRFLGGFESGDRVVQLFGNGPQFCQRGRTFIDHGVSGIRHITLINMLHDMGGDAGPVVKCGLIFLRQSVGGAVGFGKQVDVFLYFLHTTLDTGLQLGNGLCIVYRKRNDHFTQITGSGADGNPTVLDSSRGGSDFVGQNIRIGTDIDQTGHTQNTDDGCQNYDG